MRKKLRLKEEKPMAKIRSNLFLGTVIIIGISIMMIGLIVALEIGGVL